MYKLNDSLLVTRNMLSSNINKLEEIEIKNLIENAKMLFGNEPELLDHVISYASDNKNISTLYSKLRIP